MTYAIFVLVGAVIVLLAVVPRRRKRVDALEEVAIAAGWIEIRRSLIGTSVVGTWNGHAARIAVHSDDDDHYFLRTWVNSETGAHIDIGSGSLHNWEGVFESVGLLRTFPRIRLKEPSLERFVVTSDNETLARFILDDAMLVEAMRKSGFIRITPKRIYVQSDLSDFVIRFQELASLARYAREDWDLVVQLYKRIRAQR